MALYSFEGVSVIMIIENRMQNPQHFIAWNGVLNSSCLVVLAIFAVVGFYGYLSFGDDVKDTVILNLPTDPFYQTLKIMFVFCVWISYPIQFFVPLERVEKFITRKCPADKHDQYSYMARFILVLVTLAFAEFIPHLALFIALIGAVCCSILALLFPPIIDLLVQYNKGNLTTRVIVIDSLLLCTFVLGFVTGSYSAISDILKTFD
jgi:proton-coupled amino acid transporter